jgi:flagellar biosynthesis/type III secretory pathway protein FliH
MPTFTTKFTFIRLNDGAIAPLPNGARIASEDYQEYLDLEETKRRVQAQLDEVLAKARQEGLEQGRIDAQNELFQKVTDMKSTMNEWIAKTDEKLVQVVGQCVEEVVRKVDASAIIRESVEKGLANLHGATAIEIVVAAKNADIVTPLLEKSPSAKIVIDDAMGDADCIIRSPLGTMDFRLDQQLKTLGEAIHG